MKYALEHKSVILFDAAYEAYITEPGIPHSIYEIPGARECAIEFRSFSKNGGFTGVRCAFTVVPEIAATRRRNPASSNRCIRCGTAASTTKFNGVSYIVQRGGGSALFAGRQSTG